MFDNDKTRFGNPEPIVFTSPTIYEAVLNENILLECKVNEKLIPERHWEFKGNTLLSGSYVQQFEERMQQHRVAAIINMLYSYVKRVLFYRGTFPT